MPVEEVEEVEEVVAAVAGALVGVDQIEGRH